MDLKLIIDLIEFLIFVFFFKSAVINFYYFLNIKLI